ncbi:MAG: HlyD family secretion protein, partial [Terrimicrobiaceae bacterium]
VGLEFPALFCGFGDCFWMFDRIDFGAMTSGFFKKGVTMAVVVLALGFSVVMSWRYSTKPWTRDGQVQANVVGIAPRVEGPVINIPVKDNQSVKKGDLLFEIDPSTYIAARDKADAALKQSQAAQIQAKQELDRQTTLYEQKVTDIRDLQNAQDTFMASTANVAAAQAELAGAELNLGFTKAFAPVDGYLTNVNTSVGTYVAAGQQLLALVDGSSFWIAANFKETQLHQLTVGDTVTIRLMGYGNAPFEGVVQGVAWGIFQSDGSTVDLLPDVSQTVDWVRLPNRFPVRIQVTGTPPVPLRIGQTASVAIAGAAK